MVEDFVIETKGLRKTFISKQRGGKKEIEAVKGIDLTVGKGEIFGFLGPNGAGKSTTQKMLSTLLCPTGGEAKVLGYDLAEQQEQIRQNVGCVSQAGGADSEFYRCRESSPPGSTIWLGYFDCKEICDRIRGAFPDGLIHRATGLILFWWPKASLRCCAWDDSPSTTTSSR